MGGGSKGREQGAGLTCACLSLVSQMEEARAIHGRNGTVERRGTCTCSICMHVHVHIMLWFVRRYSTCTCTCTHCVVVCLVHVHNVCIYTCMQCQLDYSLSLPCSLPLPPPPPPPPSLPPSLPPYSMKSIVRFTLKRKLSFCVFEDLDSGRKTSSVSRS